jgi:hypothetical protein
MSVKIMTVVWTLDLPHADKIVLLALADNANDDGYCYPSTTTVSKKCGMAERSVRRVLARLVEQGHLSINERRGRSSTYDVHPGPSVTPDRPSPLTVSQDTPDRPSSPPRTVRPDTPDRGSPITIIEPSIEPSREPKNAHSRLGPSVEAVFEHWKREWNHPGSRLDTKRRRRIEARLKDFSLEQLCRAISGFKNSPWHTGTDPKSQGTVYDSIECLLRDSSQVEKGIRMHEAPPAAPEQLSPVERIRRALAESRNTPDDRVVSEQSGSGVAAVGRLLRRIPGT